MTAVCLCWVMRGMALCSKSTAIHMQDTLLKCDCAAWSNKWILTLYKMITARIMLSEYQNAQIKQYLMLTMQNINKISNKINWIQRSCVTVHCIIKQFISTVSILLAVWNYIQSGSIWSCIDCKEFMLNKVVASFDHKSCACRNQMRGQGWFVIGTWHDYNRQLSLCIKTKAAH